MTKRVAIIGAGPGGYVAAIRAAQLGCGVTLIEKDRVGGVCLNRGCIPTKTMAATAELLERARRAAEYGLAAGEVRPEMPRLRARQEAVVKRLAGGIGLLLQKHKIELIQGAARFISPHELEVALPDGGRRTVAADAFVIAVGTRAEAPAVFGYDGATVITSDEALQIEEIPSRLVVVGGGVVGCEFASIFSALGAKVTVLELMPGLLPMLDAELGRALSLSFKKRGIEAVTGARVAKVVKENGGARVELEDGRSFQADRVLISIGRHAETEALNPGAAGIRVDERGRIPVDRGLRTNVPHIYAIGDVNDLPYDLAHVASHHGLVAAANIAGEERTVETEVVPSVVFTLPEIASVGRTAEGAAAAGIRVQTGKFPFLASGKAVAMGETEGFVKIVADAETGRILGVHIMGPHASDLIAEGALAVRTGATLETVAWTIHAHPTLAETFMEAAEAAHGR
ncbi:MAG: dihydrolipoyl dehydrogenase, partial [Bacteroidota bacterium]